MYRWITCVLCVIQPLAHFSAPLDHFSVPLDHFSAPLDHFKMIQRTVGSFKNDPKDQFSAPLDQVEISVLISTRTRLCTRHARAPLDQVGISVLISTRTRLRTRHVTHACVCVCAHVLVGVLRTHKFVCVLPHKHMRA